MNGTNNQNKFSFNENKTQRINSFEYLNPNHYNQEPYQKVSQKKKKKKNHTKNQPQLKIKIQSQLQTQNQTQQIKTSSKLKPPKKSSQIHKNVKPQHNSLHYQNSGSL